jgi:hypothetical protein
MADLEKPDVRIVLHEKTISYQGFFQVDRYKLKHKKHEGG